MDPLVYIISTTNNFLVSSLSQIEFLANQVISAYTPKGTFAGTNITRNISYITKTLINTLQVPPGKQMTEKQLRKYSQKYIN